MLKQQTETRSNIGPKEGFDVLKEWAEYHSFSQADLAAFFKVTKSAVSVWFIKQRLPYKYYWQMKQPDSVDKIFLLIDKRNKQSHINVSEGAKKGAKKRNIQYSEKFIDILKEWIKLENITVKEAASQIGVHRSTVYSWLNGETPVPRNVRYNIKYRLNKLKNNNGVTNAE